MSRFDIHYNEGSTRTIEAARAAYDYDDSVFTFFDATGGILAWVPDRDVRMVRMVTETGEA